MDFSIKTWQQISEIAQIIGILSIVFLLFHAKPFLLELVEHRRLTMFRDIIGEIGAQEVRDIRSWLYENDIQNQPSHEEHCKITRIAVAYDRVGFLIGEDLEYLKRFDDFQGDEVIYIWEKIKNIVLTLRTSRNNPNYCHHFEQLYNAVKAMRKS